MAASNGTRRPFERSASASAAGASGASVLSGAPRVAGNRQITPGRPLAGGSWPSSFRAAHVSLVKPVAASSVPGRSLAHRCCSPTFAGLATSALTTQATSASCCGAAATEMRFQGRDAAASATAWLRQNAVSVRAVESSPDSCASLAKRRARCGESKTRRRRGLATPAPGAPALKRRSRRPRRIEVRAPPQSRRAARRSARSPTVFRPATWTSRPESGRSRAIASAARASTSPPAAAVTERKPDVTCGVRGGTSPRPEPGESGPPRRAMPPRALARRSRW